MAQNKKSSDSAGDKQSEVDISDTVDPSFDPIDAMAYDWLMTLTTTEDIASVLPQVDAWLLKSPAHEKAFNEMQVLFRLIKPLLSVVHSGGGVTETKALRDAIKKEIAQARRATTA
jgi:ferric-dicitrate binding protein FerR (iron transport regulator)